MDVRFCDDLKDIDLLRVAILNLTDEKIVLGGIQKGTLFDCDVMENTKNIFTSST